MAIAHVVGWGVERVSVCLRPLHVCVRSQRKDDTPGVVAERLNLYHETTAPVVAHYRDLNLCETFSGEATNEIYPRLHAYVRGWLRGRQK